jgi:heat shock protein HslJ
MGCNSGSGDYRMAAGTIIPGAFASTRMACDFATDEPQSVPRMTWESWGFAVLSQPMQMQWRSGREMTLSNSAGSIALELLP